MASRLSTFSKIFRGVQSVRSVIEFGANIGLNLEAIKLLLPNVELAAIEINKSAIEELKKIDSVEVYASSILDFEPDITRELSLSKGVLIHINPDELQGGTTSCTTAAIAISASLNTIIRHPSKCRIGGTAASYSSGILPARCWTNTPTYN